MQIDTATIQRMADEIRAILGDDYDDETFTDTMEGETDAIYIIGRLIKDRQEAKHMAEGVKALVKDYQDRISRLQTKEAACNRALGVVLDAMGVSKVQHEYATVSRTKPRVQCVITEPSDVPSQLCKTTVTPDKAAIKKQLESGEAVPGAELVDGEAGVSVRVK